MGARSSPGAGETIHAVVACSGRGSRAVKLCPVRTRPRTVTALFLSLFAVPAVLAGCADPHARSASSGTSSSPSASAAASETAGETAAAQSPTEAGDTGGPAFPANAEPDTADASP